MKIKISRKNEIFEVLIDDIDWPLIKNYSWNIIPAKNTNYACAYIKGSYAQGKRKRIYLHRLIMNAQDDIDIDHDNRNGLDCRQKNLLLIKTSGNNRKAKRPNKTGFKGVAKNKSGNFMVHIRIDGKKKYLGTFKTAEEAGAVYQKEYNKQLKCEIL